MPVLRRFHRRIAVVLVVSGSVAPLIWSGSASATGASYCSTVSGGTGRGAQLGTCPDGVATSDGGSIVKSPVFQGSKTRTIYWGANQTQTVVRLVTHRASAHRANKTGLCTNAAYVLVVGGSVISDTSTIASPGDPVSARLCLDANGSFNEETGTVFAF